MSYTKFKARTLEEKFNIQFKAKHLFKNTEAISPTDWLVEAVKRAKIIGFSSEKSRSERLVSPILTELSVLNEHRFTIYSGLRLDVDEKTGLNGECDFVLSLSKIPDFIKAPIFAIAEAKKNDIEAGTTQCAAQLIAAQMLNKQEDSHFDKTIYGCSTTGVEWRFLTLKDNILTIDLDRYYIHQLEDLLGVLQHILDVSGGKV